MDEAVARSTYRKFTREDQRVLGAWAADCAEQVLALFEEAFPADQRPRAAIEACRRWVRTGEFRMVVIRAASLGAHAAARDAEAGSAAQLAARAAGQAVATAHVTQHAYGAILYALKALAAAHKDYGIEELTKARDRMASPLPASLRDEVIDRLTMRRTSKGIAVSLRKGEGF